MNQKDLLDHLVFIESNIPKMKGLAQITSKRERETTLLKTKWCCSQQ